MLGELLDQDRVHDRRCDRRVAEHVLFDAGRLDDLRVKVEQRFAVREVERRVGVHLPPDEHVLGGQRDLLVAVAHVGADGIHDLVLRHVDLRVEIRQAELAAPAAPGGHLDDAERRALVGKDDALAIVRMCRLRRCRGSSSPRSAWSNRSSVSSDSLRPSTTQSTLRSSHASVWTICQPPEPPTMTLKRGAVRAGLDDLEHLASRSGN